MLTIQQIPCGPSEDTPTLEVVWGASLSSQELARPHSEGPAPTQPPDASSEGATLWLLEAFGGMLLQGGNSCNSGAGGNPFSNKEDADPQEGRARGRGA